MHYYNFLICLTLL